MNVCGALLILEKLDELILMCQTRHMATNLKLDENLLEKALGLSGRKTKREAVNDALTEFVERRERLGILEFFGTLEINPAVNDKVRDGEA